MFTEQQLIDSGYEPFKDTMSYADAFYQKRVWDSDGHTTLYFINLYKYAYTNHWELNMAFDRDSKACPYAWIKYQVSHTASIEHVEDIARDVFDSNYGIPYDKMK